MPPKKDPSLSLVNYIPSYLTTPLTKPFLYFSFSAYLLYCSVTINAVTIRLTMMNPRRRVKSITPHFVNPMIESVLGEPRSKLTNKAKATRNRLRPCTQDILCSEASYSIILSTSISSFSGFAIGANDLSPSSSSS